MRLAPDLTKTYLEIGSHILDHQPKDLAADIKYPVDRARAIASDAETEVELDGLKETRGFVAFRILNRTQGRSEDGNVVVEEGVDEVEGDELGAHRLAADIVELIGRQNLGGQVAE